MTLISLLFPLVCLLNVSFLLRFHKVAPWSSKPQHHSSKMEHCVLFKMCNTPSWGKEVSSCSSHIISEILSPISLNLFMLLHTKSFWLAYILKLCSISNVSVFLLLLMTSLKMPFKIFKLITNTGGLTHTYQSGPTPGPGVGERKWPKENHSAIGLRMLSTVK